MLTQSERRIVPAIKRLCGLMICGLLLLSLAGCPYVIAGGAAATGALYYKGELRAKLDAPPDEVMSATQKAFDYLQWNTVEIKASRTDGIAKATTAAGKEIDVTVDADPPRQSDISIRVGVFGDEDISQLLFEKIKEYLRSGVANI